MQPSSRPRSSLARSTLLKMGARIAVIIALSTGFSYLHIRHTLRTEALVHLEQYVLESVQREQAVFLFAQRNHAVLKEALKARIQELSQEEVTTRFDRLFEPLPDGTVRSRTEDFDGTRMPGLFVLRGVHLDAEMRRKILASYEVLAQHGPGELDTYVLLPEGAMVGYNPRYPTWFLDHNWASYQVSQFKSRRLGWSERVNTTPSVASLSTPVDQDGRHVATLKHDISLEALSARTLHSYRPGAYNIIFRDDGERLISPGLERTHRRAIFDRVTASPHGQFVLELPEYREYIAAARIVGPGWNFVTVIPSHIETKHALQAARNVLFLGLAVLLLELSIMFWVLRQQITQPLQAFTRATDQVTAGDFEVSLKTSREDELGRLAHGFELMAQEVHRREAALRQANEGLESRIQERTQELQEKNLKLEGAMAQLEETQALLVQKEKLASLGALVSGIAHEIKNPLNFVNNFAQLSVDLVQELRAELKAPQASPSASRLPELGELLEMLEQNVRKIDEHGRRADSIVRNMQLHARSASSERKPTNLNALLEEHLNLASESMQVTNPGLRVAIHKQMDPNVGKLDLVPQDFGRALLNVLNNSLYAVAEKKKSVGEGFTPEVTVSSRSAGRRVEIRIRDNGTGIPQKIHDKIFNPFFTTKPAGAGTGLGLSITYDIVVRQHQGEIRIDSTEGQYTECLIVLSQSAA